MNDLHVTNKDPIGSEMSIMMIIIAQVNERSGRCYLLIKNEKRPLRYKLRLMCDLDSQATISFERKKCLLVITMIIIPKLASEESAFTSLQQMENALKIAD